LKLRVHAREWTASKLRPRVYGDKIDLSVQHTQITVLAALERAEQRASGSVTFSRTMARSARDHLPT